MSSNPTYTLSQQQLQNVLDYLTKRPYAEVHQLVTMILAVPVDSTPSSQTTIDVTPKQA